MKKSIFSLAFLLSIIVVSFSEVSAQSISSFFNLKFSEETIVNEQQESSTINVIEENDKKNNLNKEEALEESKIDKSNMQPSSSRISIALGKVLFEKYIK